MRRDGEDKGGDCRLSSPWMSGEAKIKEVMAGYLRRNERRGEDKGGDSKISSPELSREVKK